MTTVLYDYPKSSCSCLNCDKDDFIIPTGQPTNMSIRSCISSEYYDCNPRSLFKVHQEPAHNTGTILLNPSVIAPEKHNQTFRLIDQKKCPRSACSGKTFLNSDPRLYNAAAETWLQLDSPPLTSTQSLNTLSTDKTLDCYGQNYQSYADVNAGQYLYYIGRDREDAFYEPLFSKTSTVVGTLYKDPMGAMKPQYDRIPVERLNPILGQESDDVTGDFCLSDMKDSQFHREDLLARQMSRRNQQRYAPRWTNINK